MLNQVIIIAEIFLGEKTYQLLCLRTKKLLAPLKKSFPAGLLLLHLTPGNLNQTPLCKLKLNQEMEIQQIKFKPFFPPNTKHRTTVTYSGGEAGIFLSSRPFWSTK